MPKRRNGAALTASPGNQSLSVNGVAYTLLHNMTDVGNINNALGGNYALATNIDASTAGIYTAAVVGKSGVRTARLGSPPWRAGKNTSPFWT